MRDCLVQETPVPASLVGELTDSTTLLENSGSAPASALSKTGTCSCVARSTASASQRPAVKSSTDWQRSARFALQRAPVLPAGPADGGNKRTIWEHSGVASARAPPSGPPRTARSYTTL